MGINTVYITTNVCTRVIEPGNGMFNKLAVYLNEMFEECPDVRAERVYRIRRNGKTCTPLSLLRLEEFCENFSTWAEFEMYLITRALHYRRIEGLFDNYLLVDTEHSNVKGILSENYSNHIGYHPNDRLVSTIKGFVNIKTHRVVSDICGEYFCSPWKCTGIIRRSNFDDVESALDRYTTDNYELIDRNEILAGYLEAKRKWQKFTTIELIEHLYSTVSIAVADLFTSCKFIKESLAYGMDDAIVKTLEDNGYSFFLQVYSYLTHEIPRIMENTTPEEKMLIEANRSWNELMNSAKSVVLAVRCEGEEVQIKAKTFPCSIIRCISNHVILDRDCFKNIIPEYTDHMNKAEEKAYLHFLSNITDSNPRDFAKNFKPEYLKGISYRGKVRWTLPECA